MANSGSLVFDDAREARKRLKLAAGAGAVVALLVALLGVGGFFDWKLLDTWFAIRGDHEPSTQVAVVSIDQKSITSIGAFPWRRDRYVPLLDKLRQAGARVVGFDVIFEPNPDQDEPGATGVAPNQALADAFRASGNVVFSMLFDNLEDSSPPGADPPESFLRNALRPFDTTPWDFPPSPTVHPGQPQLVEAAAAVGHVNTIVDPYGGVRWSTLFVRHGRRVYPSLALQVVRLYLGKGTEEFKLQPGWLDLEYGHVPITRRGLTLLNWPQWPPSFKTYPVVDVLRGEVPPEAFKDRVVLIAATAEGLDERPFPFANSAPGVLSHATFIENFFKLRHLGWPTWSWLLEWGLLLGFAGLAVLAFPRLGTGWLLALGGGLMVATALLGFGLFLASGVWFRAFHPMLGVALPLAATLTLKLRQTEKATRDVEAERRESQLLLGLSLQEKGMLDMALATFSKLPMSDQLKTALRNLGVDFENRGMGEKAFLAYKRVFDVDPGYEDIAVRMEQLRRAGIGTHYFAEPTVGVPLRTGATMVPTLGSAPTMAPGGAPTQATSPTQTPTSVEQDVEATHALGEGAPTLAGNAEATHGLAGAPAAPSATAMPTRAPASTPTAVPGAQPAAPAAPPGVGTMFGRYQILQKLGRGAMGDVFKVMDPRMKRTAALKTIRDDIDVPAQQRIELRQRFYREAESAGGLTHPNIVTIYDVGEEQGTAFIVMEFVEGQTLTSLLRQRKVLNSTQVKNLLIQAAQGLSFAHQNGIIHRDIKPDNIMISKTGVVKLMDFGIARVVESDMTRTGTVLGTPAYMSPEQFAGKKVGPQSDLFSLGVVLYELLTLKRPFHGDTPTNIMFAIMQQDPPPPSVAQPKVDPKWDPLLAKALAKNPAERFQSADEFASAIRAVPVK